MGLNTGPELTTREAVVGDHVADIAVEQAARLAQVQGEVVALAVPVAMQQHGGDGGAGYDGRKGQRPADTLAMCDLRRRH